MKVGKWCSVGLNELPDYHRLAPLMSCLPHELSSNSPQALPAFSRVKMVGTGFFSPISLC